MFAFSLVGFGFLAKMLQALIVLPAFGLVYLFAGPPRLGRRIWQLFLGGVAMLASAGWWIVAVQLWPAASRPYIGGSQNNSLWNLMFGYNGFGRLTGNENGSVGGGGAQARGPVGPDRAGRACSTPSSAVRSRGCCPRRWCCSSPGSWSRGAGRAPTARAPRCCCGAAGCS